MRCGADARLTKSESGCSDHRGSHGSRPIEGLVVLWDSEEQKVLRVTDTGVVPVPAWVSYTEMVRLAEGVPVIVRCGADTGFKLTPQQLELRVLAPQRGEDQKLVGGVVFVAFVDQVGDVAGEGQGLPQFVEREFRKFLTCGSLAGGFARFRCAGCGVDRLVAFSCKGAGSVRAVGAGG